MVDITAFTDELGPARIIDVWQPELGLHGTLVVDNIACGPAIGGLRMAQDVSTAECFRLARAMTLKNAAAGLPHGGGKSVLRADPKMDQARKETCIRAFASALEQEHGYIFGPDMGTNEQAMAWVKDEIGRAVGLPPELGGIPLDELGATGWGLLHSVQAAFEHLGLSLAGARITMQGYGSVGFHAARFMTERGARLVGASDSGGAVCDEEGMDPLALARWKSETGSVTGFPSAQPLAAEDLVAVPCEVWVPAARPDVLDESNVARLQARVVAQGANIPATAEAERYMHEHGITVLPDFIANAGGVICAAMEYQGATQQAAFETIAQKVRANTAEVLESAARDSITPRAAGERMAGQRVRNAMRTRRWSIY